MNYFLGKTSLKRLETCHPAWLEILTEVLKDSPIDIGVVCGGRDEEEQTLCYNAKTSNAKWGESDHNWKLGNKLCSIAVDIAPYSDKIRGYLTDARSYKLMSDHVIKVAARLGYTVDSGVNYTTIVGGDAPHHVLKFRNPN